MAGKQENEQPSSAEKTDRPTRTLASRLSIYTIFVLLALLLGVYAWKEFTVRSLERKMDLQRTEMSIQQQNALDAQARDMLRLTALPLAWAVRAEWMRGNLSQIDDYFRDFVKEAGVQAIFLIDSKNMVVLATNRKLETQSADQVVSQTIRDAESVVIEKADSIVRMAMPIMSLNEKLGILVIDYDPQASQAPKLQR